MSLQGFKNKHLEKSLFSPTDYINYKKWDRSKFPKKYVLIYPSSIKRYFLKNYKTKKYHLYSLLDIYVYKDIGFVKMHGIGSPLAGAIMEELIALGGKKFINIGTAGGLNKEGIFLCEKALRDEGTSHHYAPKGRFSYPDKELTEKLARNLEKLGIEFSMGISWTIDAPYRETKKEVEKYVKEGITNVEMEASALFVIAKYRKVKIASVFVVSDLLGKKWLPKFHRFDIRRSLNKVFDAGVECLRS